MVLGYILYTTLGHADLNSAHTADQFPFGLRNSFLEDSLYVTIHKL